MKFEDMLTNFVVDDAPFEVVFVFPDGTSATLMARIPSTISEWQKHKQSLQEFLERRVKGINLAQEAALAACPDEEIGHLYTIHKFCVDPPISMDEAAKLRHSPYFVESFLEAINKRRVRMTSAAFAEGIASGKGESTTSPDS
jgi:hypothetical protein